MTTVKGYQVLSFHQSDLRRGNSCEFRYAFMVVI